MNLKFREFFISEAISIKDAKKMGLNRKNGGAYGVEVLNDVFKGKDRIIYPFKVSDDEIINDSPIFRDLTSFLDLNGYNIHSFENYKKGIAYKQEDTSKKQPMKIGKILNKLSNSENYGEVNKRMAKKYADAFRDDPTRSAKKEGYSVVISRHPYDIAGMSTDRNWSSCMNLGLKGIQYKKDKSSSGSYAHHVKKDISEGSIIAYLVDNDDRHKNGKIALNRPISRSLLKPYVNKKDSSDYAYSRGKIYGAPVTEFGNFLNDWLKNNINTNTKDKSYILKRGLYGDGDITVGFDGSGKNNTIMQYIFYEMLDENNDPKIHQYFDIDGGEAYYGGRECTIHAIFELGLYEAQSFTYNTHDTLPTYVKELLAGVNYLNPKDSNYIPHKNLDEIAFDENLLHVTATFTDNYYEPEYDEKGEPIIPTDDDEENYWESFFRSIDIDDFDYFETRKHIEKIIQNSNIEDEKNNEMDDLISTFNIIKDNEIIKDLTKELSKEYPKALKLRNYFLQFVDSSIMELYNKASNDSQFHENSLKLQEFFKKFMFLKWKFDTMARGKLDYAHISGYDLYQKMVDKYLNFEKYNEDFKPLVKLGPTTKIYLDSGKFRGFRQEISDDEFSEENLDDLEYILFNVSNYKPHIR